MEPNWETIIKDGWRHRENPQELIRYFIQLSHEFPQSARAKFELANAYDYLGEEEKAIPYYEQAIRFGLSPEYEAYAMLQLGSSLRNAGRLQEAEKLLADAEKRFPEMPSISIFLSMVFLDLKKNDEAVRTILKAMLKHVKSPDMDRYKSALDYYIREI